MDTLFRLALVMTVALCSAAPALAAGYPDVDLQSPSGPLPLDPRSDVDAWQGAAIAKITWEVQRARPVTEPATARIAIDQNYLYVRFDVTQREPIAQSQRTDDVGLGTDDEVWVDLWPNDVGGYLYQFIATPNGTHYESSTENTTYAPRWESQGTVRNGGYTVTMKIPLAVIHGAQTSRRWKLQFVRFNRATGELAVWSYDRAQTLPDDLARAGSLKLPLIAAAHRPQPRIAPYILGSAAAPAAGGSTSRMGADISIPFSETSSFFATLHPDFSNVELDQQTISPTAFQRQFAEVRPFFTQGANNYNGLYCNFCNALTPLYTPSIPTPREGYAVEGKLGAYGYSAFDAVGVGRNDQTEAITYTSPDTRWNAAFQRVAVNAPSLNDDETVTGVWYTDLKRWTFYANYGSDAGTNVTNAAQAQYYDTGATWTSNTFSAWGGIHKIGDDFNPVDAFITKSGVGGWGLFANKIWTFSARDAIAAVSLGEAITRNHGDAGLNQTVSKTDIDVLTRKSFDVNITSGSSSLSLDDGLLTPVSQNGIAVIYHSGSQTNNPISFDAHGPSSTPTTLSFNTGRYGSGTLDTWIRSSTLRLGSRGTLTLDLDDTAQRLDAGTNNTQWFERIGYTEQISSESSVSLGIRNVVGAPPVPNGGGGCDGRCANISFAYHARLSHLELYFAYGDPNALTTVPQLLFKAIFYSGADKGT